MIFHQFIISGCVQGVGFRPFICREAQKKNLKGWIKNTSQGVEIVVNDRSTLEGILQNLPPLAVIKKQVVEVYVPDKIPNTFCIQASEANANSGASIPADTATCDDCLTELLEVKNRRHKYFFISCTNCGPRWSIAQKLPFDRPHTTLKDFELCAACQHEYQDPADRRFHAQTIACPQCGPQLEFYQHGKKLETNPLAHTIKLLQQNKVVSIKGIGGFCFASRATPTSTQALRQQLLRPHKPLAIMVKNLEAAQQLCHLSDPELQALTATPRPIVLLRKKNTDYDHLSQNGRLGLMLPYSGLHQLLLEALDEPLLVTSANLPGIPIPITQEDQNWPYVLDYNRAIENFSDDSIVKVINNHPLLIRRSRGYVPQSLNIPENFQTFKGDILAVGSELKNTFALKKDSQVIMSPHLGDVGKTQNFERWQQTLNTFITQNKAQPKVVLCDAHPQSNCREWAEAYAQENQIKVIPVQHHLAHSFSVAFEHNQTDFYGLVADGLGWGPGDTIWGGEVFYREQRIGHLEPQLLVGGDAANKDPIRYLTGILQNFMSLPGIQKLLNEANPAALKIYAQQAEQNFNCMPSSSTGRVIDAAAILLGLGQTNLYEGFLAEQLEAAAEQVTNAQTQDLDPIIKEVEGQYILYTTPLFKYLVAHAPHDKPAVLARLTLNYLSKGFWEITQKHQAKNNLPSLPRLWSGGCAYSTVMTEYFLKKGALINQQIPAGDGGISVGQIAYYLWKSGDQTKKTK